MAEALGFQTLPKQQHYDLIIVGAGPAGISAAVYSASEGLTVLLVERFTAGGQAVSSSRIENYLGFPGGISGDELTQRALKQAKHFGVEILFLRNVEKVESLKNCHHVTLDGGEASNAAGGITMSTSLATYLKDHLGGAQIAVELLESMQEQHDEERFRQFAGALLPEIQADDETLRSISARIGSSPSVIKQAGGWLLEKAARMKLGHTGSVDFALFESLELLELGIRGKLCLWKALQAAASEDERFRDYDFNDLIRRANQQGDQVELERLTLARVVFK